MKKRCIFTFIGLFTLRLFAESWGIGADVSLAPNTMGTVGETIDLMMTMPPVFHLDFHGSNIKYMTSAAKMELYGSTVSGDITRDVLSGNLKFGPLFKWRRLSIFPKATGAIDYSDRYTIVRVLEPGSGLPENTSRFMDIKASESVINAGGELDMEYEGSSFVWNLSGFLNPLSNWKLDSSRFLTGATWAVELPTSGQMVQPTLYWAVRKEKLNLRSQSYGFSSAAEYHLPKTGIKIGIFGSYSLLRFAGLSDVRTTGYSAYKTGDGTTPIDNIPLSFFTTQSTKPARVELSEQDLELGTSLKLLFLRDILRLNGSPSLRISWARKSRDNLYNYLDATEDLTAEKWTETADFFKIAVSMGISSR